MFEQDGGPKSISGKTWHVPTGRSAPPKVVLSDGTHVPPEVVFITLGRGIADVAGWLEPSVRSSMPDPHVLPRVREAAVRISDAVLADEKVALYGDYDVDGATSVAQMARWIGALTGKLPRIYIPDRIIEGYGPNAKSMDTLAAEGVRLLIIQDSGTTAFEPIARARELGMDVIVLDHHEPIADGSLPDALVVNPKLADSLELGLDYLCTAGLTMFVLVACNREMRERKGFDLKGVPEPDLRQLWGLTALGTVADMVPLVKLNRAYVRTGLHYSDTNPGLHALMRATDNFEPSPYSCGFIWGPCINAGGRLGDTSRGAILLSSDDDRLCDTLAGDLRDVNEERKKVQAEMMDSAYEAIEAAGGTGSPDAVMVLANESWHPGVIGVAAGKIKERIDRSVVLIGSGGKGSARSVGNFNMGQAFHGAVKAGIISKGGGHAAAAGLTVDLARVDDLRAYLNEMSTGVVRMPLRADLVIDVDVLTVALVRAFSLMEPFGMGNPGPRILLKGGTVGKPQVMKARHLKFPLGNSRGRVQLMMWHGVDTDLGRTLTAAVGRPAEALGRLKINTYGGKENLQMEVDDIRFPTEVPRLL